MSSRDTVLGRIHAALGPRPGIPPIPRAYRGAGLEPDGPDAARRFAERAAEYRARVHRCAASELASVLDRLVAGRPAVATEPLAALLAHSARTDAPPLPVAALEGCEVVVTGVALAIADTGTLVLDGGAASGRRALTLIPDHHVCVVRSDQVVASVPDAVLVLAEAARAGRPLTFVSGPSATSDIELQRVEGVHGPRRLDVVLVG